MVIESHEPGRKIRGEVTQQPCTQQRLVDHLHGAEDRPTGTLRCVECKAVVSDPENTPHLSAGSA